MTDSIEIKTSGPIRASLRPPGSKSITNRALVCAALAEGTSKLTGVLDSDDTRLMIEGLRRLGFEIDIQQAGERVTVAGGGGHVPARGADLQVGNSGTTVRFLTALVALGRGRFRLDGVPRMRERPIEDLLVALRGLGVDARSEQSTGCPPVVVEADGLPGGRVSVRGDVSSQFLSALLMAAPQAAEDVEIEVEGPLVSTPYIRTTLGVMSAFGVDIAAADDFTRFRIPSGMKYQACNYAVEPDASAASYFFAAAAITGGEATVEGLTRDSLQGDVAFCECLARMGCQVHCGDDHIRVVGRPITGVAVDMNAISDTVQTLAAVALFAQGPTTITGVEHIRHKETDRITALACELRKLGAEVDEQRDGLRITPRSLHGAQLATYDDHRMAMSLALVGLTTPGVVILDPGCTAKTYPNYFRDLDRIIQPK